MGFLSTSCHEAISELKGKKIGKVVYYLWKNLASEDGFSSLDWIELRMQDDTLLSLNYGTENDGIEVKSVNFEEEKLKTETEFNGQATIIRENATLDKHWFPILDNEIKDVTFSEKNGELLNDKILLHFTDKHIIEISVQEEGMGVDFYEEV
ncbi:MAG: hypothetical protein KAG96_00500 [Ichthyobacteriaceae bacterium]|nr:hypothetical protein [Ichthyobacteriaceae bacterium]